MRFPLEMYVAAVFCFPHLVYAIFQISVLTSPILASIDHFCDKKSFSSGVSCCISVVSCRISSICALAIIFFQCSQLCWIYFCELFFQCLQHFFQMFGSSIVSIVFRTFVLDCCVPLNVRLYTLLVFVLEVLEEVLLLILTCLPSRLYTGADKCLNRK